MVETQEMGQPTLIFTDKVAQRMRKRINKPKVTFLWKRDGQILYLWVPEGFSAEYVQGFRDAKFLHFTLSEHTGEDLPQPFCLAIFDRADRVPSVSGTQFSNCGEPLVIGVTVYDWNEPLVPKATRQRQQAKACVHMPDGSQRFIPLLVGGWG
jgi:hypothetical protein